MKIEEIKEIAETWFEWDTDRRDYITYTSAMLFARDMYERAQAAERERIKGRVKEAAESLWCIRNQLGDDPYALYIGPPLNTMQEFVNRLLTDEVKQKAHEVGLPLATCDFSQDCKGYQQEE